MARKEKWEAAVKWDDNDDVEIVEFEVPVGTELDPRTFLENVLRKDYQAEWKIREMKPVFKR